MQGAWFTKLLGAGLLLALSCSRPALAIETPSGFELGMNALLEGNFAEAYCQWKPLAHQGHAESQYNLGWLYANGNGLNVDIRVATDWWQKAAEQGHADAQFAMGLAHTTGEGIGKDLQQASHWFVMAARQGHRDAREILNRLNLDPAVDLLAMRPELLHESWFGWTGVIAGKRVNIREKPSTQSSIVAKLENGVRVRVLGGTGDWRQILIPAAELEQASEPLLAWIYHSLVTQITQ